MRPPLSCPLRGCPSICCPPAPLRGASRLCRLSPPTPRSRPACRRPRPRPHAADRRRRDGAHPALHHRARLQLAAHRLPAGLEDACRRRRPCSATSPERRASCPTPPTSTATSACWPRRARACASSRSAPARRGASGSRWRSPPRRTSPAGGEPTRASPSSPTRARSAWTTRAPPKLVAASVPVYYITGAIHSPETGSPTALMELAYRLAVDESPYIRKIRDNLITLITPVVEVDGRDRMVDLYRWHRAHPDAAWPRLVYWGHYVAHDNNRDAMALTLSLTRNVLDTHLGWHAQVLHDLHESVPFLYDNTVGDGPYNAWIDPMLTNEWQLFGWTNVAEMTKLGMPGVFTHGDFDTWSPGYLMFLAAMHNCDQPPLRDLRQRRRRHRGARALARAVLAHLVSARIRPGRASTGRSATTTTTSRRGSSSRSPSRPRTATQLLSQLLPQGQALDREAAREGPSAWVLPGRRPPRPRRRPSSCGCSAGQHVEISRASQRPFPVALRRADADGHGSELDAGKARRAAETAASKSAPPAARLLPAGSYVVRMDQPYSRIADALLDRQYWSPGRSAEAPLRRHRLELRRALRRRSAARRRRRRFSPRRWSLVAEPVRRAGGRQRHGAGLPGGAPRRRRDAAAALRARRRADRDATSDVQGRGCDGAVPRPGARLPARQLDRHRRRPRAACARLATRLGIAIVAAAERPPVATRPSPARGSPCSTAGSAPRPKGWWRQRLDLLGVPYDYISTQDVAATPDLAREVRRHPLSAGRRRRAAADRHRSADVGRAAALADDRRRRRTSARSTPPTTSVPGSASRGSSTCGASSRAADSWSRSKTPRELLIANGLTPGVRVTDAGDVKVAGQHPRRPLPGVGGIGALAGHRRLRRAVSRSTAPRG